MSTLASAAQLLHLAVKVYFADAARRVRRHPITMMTAINVTARVTSRKSLALAGYVSAFYVHDGVAEQGYKTLTMLETKHWDSCPIYLLHLVRP